MLLKRRREEFASVQGQLLHFQEDSATDERRQIKGEGEVAIFIIYRHLNVTAVNISSSENHHVLCIDKRVLPPLQGRGDITGGARVGSGE